MTVKNKHDDAEHLMKRIDRALNPKKLARKIEERLDFEVDSIQKKGIGFVRSAYENVRSENDVTENVKSVQQLIALVRVFSASKRQSNPDFKKEVSMFLVDQKITIDTLYDFFISLESRINLFIGKEEKIREYIKYFLCYEAFTDIDTLDDVYYLKSLKIFSILKNKLKFHRGISNYIEERQTEKSDKALAIANELRTIRDKKNLEIEDVKIIIHHARSNYSDSNTALIAELLEKLKSRLAQNNIKIENFEILNDSERAEDIPNTESRKLIDILEPFIGILKTNFEGFEAVNTKKLKNPILLRKYLRSLLNTFSLTNIDLKEINAIKDILMSPELTKLIYQSQVTKSSLINIRKDPNDFSNFLDDELEALLFAPSLLQATRQLFRFRQTDAVLDKNFGSDMGLNRLISFETSLVDTLSSIQNYKADTDVYSNAQFDKIVEAATELIDIFIFCYNSSDKNSSKRKFIDYVRGTSTHLV